MEKLGGGATEVAEDPVLVEGVMVMVEVEVVPGVVVTVLLEGSVKVLTVKLEWVEGVDDGRLDVEQLGYTVTVVEGQ